MEDIISSADYARWVKLAAALRQIGVAVRANVREDPRFAGNSFAILFAGEIETSGTLIATCVRHPEWAAAMLAHGGPVDVDARVTWIIETCAFSSAPEQE